MEVNNIKIRSVITKGWSGMLFVLLLMMITDLIECGMKNDFSLLLKDPGISGLYLIVIMAITNVIVQISVFTFENKIFKWTVFVLSMLYTLLFVAHQVDHLMAGEGIDMHFFLDITHHLLGIWTTIYAYKWARLRN